MKAKLHESTTATPLKFAALIPSHAKLSVRKGKRTEAVKAIHYQKGRVVRQSQEVRPG